jgi:hypothetical protein
MSGRGKVLGLVAVGVMAVGIGYVVTALERPVGTPEPAGEVAHPAPSAPAPAPLPLPAVPGRDAPAPAPAAARAVPPAPPDAAVPPRAQPLPENAASRATKINAAAYQTEHMDALRQLVETDPQKAIELARVANRRFPNSPEAAERSWIVVKGLANLKRFHDARDEAKVMVQKYPGNKFALDAERHATVYPLDQPSREQMQEAEKKK